MKSFVTSVLIASLFLSAPGALTVSAAQRDALKKKALMGVEQQPLEEQEGAFGDQVKSAASLSQGPMLEKAVDPDGYVLGPYDELVVSMMGPEPRTYSLTVLPEGDVFLPGVGAIHADGLTINEFRRALAGKVEMYFRNIELYCYLVSPAVFRVFVTGEVVNPGPVAVSGVERVTDAIEKAGSVKSNGSLRIISLERGGALVRIDLLRFIIRGDVKNNPMLRSGDRIHVPPAGAHASISGQVKKPGGYEILEGETIADLIELAGGFTSDAIEDSILMSRKATGIGGGASVETVSKAQFGMQLGDGDEIGVFDELKGRFTVRVEGATNRTGRFRLAPHEGVSELIVRAGGFTDKADLSAAYIARKSGEIVKANLAEYLSPDPVKRLALEDGDVLTIPEIRRTVTVGGEVNEPGEFNYSGDLTVIQYIGLAGGPSKDGSVGRVVIYSPDGTARAASKGAHPNRGDVIIVKKSGYKIFGSFFDGALRIGAIIVSILILNK